MTDPEPAKIWLEYGSWEGDLSYVMFPGQGEPCEVPGHIDIEQSEVAEDRSVVTLYQGRDPDIDPSEPCDGPTRAFTVVLPVFEPTHDADVARLVNGVDPIDDG